MISFHAAWPHRVGAERKMLRSARIRGTLLSLSFAVLACGGGDTGSGGSAGKSGGPTRSPADRGASPDPKSAGSAEGAAGSTGSGKAGGAGDAPSRVGAAGNASAGGAGGSAAATSDNEDRGDILIQWEPADADTQELADSLRQSKLFEDVAKALNATYKLPRDLPVVHTKCGVINAFYDPQKGEVSLCYEMMALVAKVAANDPMQTDEQVAQAFVGAWLFIFFHELGHALIDIYGLPTTGKEEDAVDDFSSVVLIESDLADYALQAAQFWGALDMGEYSQLDFADEHSLNPQRFYAIVCNVYGSDPTTYAALVTKGYLPEARAAGCRTEYQKKLASWNKLLAPWAK